MTTNEIKPGSVVYMNNGWDRVVRIDERAVALEKLGRMGRSHFEFGVERGSIKVSNDKVWTATYRFRETREEYETTILGETFEIAWSKASAADVLDRSVEELVSVVEA